jgi:hypothetical protein
MQCKKEENLADCTCSWEDCPRKGLCCDCVMHHRRKGEIPGCFFPPDAEITYDRSYAYFASLFNKENYEPGAEKTSEP